MYKVIKRDNSVVVYNKLKIKNAVYKAAKAFPLKDEDANALAEKVANKVDKHFRNNYTQPISVEKIQDWVEKALMDEHKGVAKKYIIYRYKRAKARNAGRKFQEAMNVIDDYLNLNDWKVNENSNMGYSLQGLNNHIASEITKEYWLQEIYPEEIREAHINGDFHIHDLGMLSAYCCGWDLRDLLMEGFRGVPYKIESAPPKHLETALMQSVNFLYTLQGESAGAQAFSNFDTYLAPFIYYDNLSYEEVKQCMQEFIFNMNVPTRVGFQTPFSNLTMDLTCPPNMVDEPVIIGGKIMDKTYGEFQKEMDMINRAFAEVMLEGDRKGRVFTFPIPTYNITKDFNWDNETLDPVWEMTAKYGIPYFANFVNSDMKPEDARSMCCRLRLDNRVLRKRGGGLFGSNPMTGSIGVVTLNMARIGYLSKTKQEYKARVIELMDLAKASLEIKRKAIERFTENGLYPYARFYLRDVKKRFGKYWQNHFSTIGINGMNESLLNFMGKDIGSEEGREFAIEIMHLMRDRLRMYQEETDEMFNLEATPAESTAYRFALLDKEKYGNDIICANEKRVREKRAEPYYTNSTQLPVGYTDDIFEAFELQDELQSLYTGGTVLHVFTGESLPSIESTKLLVKKLAHSFKTPYFSITPTFSICASHGYIKGEEYRCPTCGEPTEVYSRVVGFLTPVSHWNKGKQEEFIDRKEFIV